MIVKVTSYNKSLLHFTFVILYFTFLLSSCSVSRQISKQAHKILINDTAISKGHIGISIYEPATGKYWYNYNADKYFIPASNTKLFTLYAGMKYLGDSIVGLRYKQQDSILIITPTADPGFLHPDFITQRVFDFLKDKKYVLLDEAGTEASWKSTALGKGWAWDDYNQEFMPERSVFPLYGNLMKIELKDDQLKFNKNEAGIFETNITVTPSLLKQDFNFDENDSASFTGIRNFYLQKEPGFRNFNITSSKTIFSKKIFPYKTSAYQSLKLLEDTVINYFLSSGEYNSEQKKELYQNHCFKFGNLEDENKKNDVRKDFSVIHSRPCDSLFKPMMYNSDNFFAEQTLLMVSNEHLGYMSDTDIIDTLLKKDFSDIPQKPRWVDGSGLSRYNLFTPQSFIYILEKMKNEFGIEHLKIILPTGGQGSLKNYYVKDSAYIFAKTGTLSNNSSLSGFLYTRKGKLLIFSLLANNYQSGATPVRRAFEHFLTWLRKKN